MEFFLIILLIPVVVLALIYLLRYPEVAFGIFLFAYVIQGGLKLPWFLNLTVIVLSISIVGFIAKLAISNKNKFEMNLADFLLFGFIIVLFFGSYLAPDSNPGFIKALRFVAIVFFPYFLTRIFLDKKEEVCRFLKTILFTAFAVAAMLVLGVLFGFIEPEGRVIFLEANPIPTATFFVLGLIIALVGTMLNSQKKEKIRFLYFFMLPIFIYGIFLSGARGPMVALLVALIFYFLFGFFKKITPRFRITFISTLLLLVIFFSLFGEALPNIRAYSLTSIREGLSTQYRIEQYSLVKNLFLKAPLLGVGTGGFGQLTGWVYPHNIFAEILVENGLIGLVLFILFLIIAFFCGLWFIRSFDVIDKKEKKLGLMILLICIALLVGRQFSFGLDMHKDLFVFLALLINLPIILSLDLNKKPFILKIK